MAGRILPIALATVAGISIGVATFDGEFKEQRRKKLEDEYKQEVAAMSPQEATAVSSLKSAGPSPMATSSVPAPSLEQLAAKREDVKSSEASPSPWSSLLGLWAWNKNAKGETAAPTKHTSEETNGKS
ncbi:Nn.00g093950.m01.CDS01 [Neocucurbitaria sp. VM-36]